MLPLHANADVHRARSLLLRACKADENALVSAHGDGPITVEAMNGSKAFRFTIVMAEANMMSVLDTCKVADIVVPIVCPFYSDDSRDAYGVDEKSDEFVAALKAQGMPAVIALAQGLQQVPPKRLAAVRKTCIRYVQTLFDDKVKVLNGAVHAKISEQPHPDYQTLLRLIHAMKLKEMAWRSQRAYLLVDSARFDCGAESQVFIRHHCQYPVYGSQSC